MKISIPQYSSVIVNNVEISRKDSCPFIVIRGPNGSGKSTILKLILGILPGESGSKPIVRLNETHKYYPATNRYLTRYLPQIPEDALFSFLSVSDNIKLLIDLLPIKDSSFANHLSLNNAIPAWQLSVGEKKLLLLEAILSSIPDGAQNDPLIILLDEPFAGLDTNSRKTACDDLCKSAGAFSSQINTVLIIVDHSNIELSDDCLQEKITVRKDNTLELFHMSSIALRK